MQRGLAVLRDPRQDLLVGLHARPRRELAGVERIERRLVQDVPRHADRLDPLATVLVGRQVVEAQRRMHAAGRVLVIFTEPRASEYIGPMCTW